MVVRQERLESMENRDVIEDESIEVLRREISIPEDENEMIDLNILITN